MLRLAALVAVGLVGLGAVVPAAAACSLVAPGSFGEVQWVEPGRLLTNRDYDVGWFRLSDGAFDVVANSFWQVEERVALSPDRRWLVYAEQEGLGADCSSDRETTFRLDLVDDRSYALGSGAPRIAGGPLGVATFKWQASSYTWYKWGDWKANARPFPQGADGVRPYALAPSNLVALHEQKDRQVHVLDPTTETLLAHSAKPLSVMGKPAASPDGRHVAFVWSTESYEKDPHTDLVLLEVKGKELVHRATFRNGSASDGRAFGLSWGRAGLVLTRGDELLLFRNPWSPDAVRRYDADAYTGRAVWAPDGPRLAVSHGELGESLRILDVNRTKQTTYTRDGDGPFVKGPETNLGSKVLPRGSWTTVAGGAGPAASERSTPELSGEAIPMASLAWLAVGLVFLRRRRG